MGSIAEIFEGEPPFRPRGCIAQAWSVSETLRAWMEMASETEGVQAVTPPNAEAGWTRAPSGTGLGDVGLVDTT